MVEVDGLKIGDKALRRKEHHAWDEWIEFEINETYFGLILDDPSDYQHLSGNPIKTTGWVGGEVECDICAHQWVAVRLANATKLECPNCKQWAWIESETE